MNVAGPSRRVHPLVQPHFEGMETWEIVESADEHDLEAAGEPPSDHDVAMNDFLKQARALVGSNQDRILAERAAAGEDGLGLELQRPPMAEAPRAEVPQPPTWHKRWTLATKVSQTSGPPTQRNKNQKPVENSATPSQTWRGRIAFVVGRILGSQPASSSGPKNASTTTLRTFNGPTGHNCAVCLDPIHEVEIRTSCGHYYDISCITDLFQSATRDQTLYPPRCCGENISFTQVQPHISPDLITKLQEKEAEFNTVKRVYCSSATCNQFLGPLCKGIFSRKVYTCPAPDCRRRTCGKCRDQRTGRKHVCLPDADTAQVLELSRTSGWARCPGCGHMIELHTGCYHITCRCRADFCYLCLARWKTCQCPRYGRQLPGTRRRMAVEAPVPERAARRAPIKLPPPIIPRQISRNSGPSPSPSSSSSSPPPIYTSEAVASTSTSRWTTSYDHGVTRWPGLQRQIDFRGMTLCELMERLRVDHKCDHTQWCYREGGGSCQHCGHYLPKYLFHCEGCEMLACNRCKNRHL